jgi:phage/conjugal plasmid C-4 type zinc finger TraR family protein
MDVFDRAQELDAQFRHMSIDAVKRLAAQQRLSQVDGRIICAWCEHPIPEERRQAVPGCDLCARCQSEKERMKERR